MSDKFKFIMYLDFDGVITPNNHIIQLHKKLVEENSEDTEKDFHYRNFTQKYMFSYESVKFLNDLYDIAPFVIVMTTTRRYEFSVREWNFIFKLNGVKAEVVDRTKYIKTWREEEIMEYHNREALFAVRTLPYLIIDDDTFDLHLLEDKLLHVNNETGLTTQHIDEALNILKKQNVEI